MSTILEAQRELERRGGPPPPSTQRPPKRRWPLAKIAAGMAAGVAVLALVFVWPESPPPPVAPRAQTASVEPPAIPPRSAPAPVAAPAPPEPLPRGPDAEEEEAPWGRAHPPKQSPEERLAAPQVPPREVSSLSLPSAASPPAREGVEQAAVALPGGGLVALQSITCAGGSDSCSAELSVDGRVARVHQGDAWQGVEVQLILPDTVYISQGGTVLSLRAR